MILGSIVIINYNTAKLSLQAIKSIEEKVENISDYEIILVDNASEAADFNELQSGIENFTNKQIKLIRSRINVGFGAGNTIGVQNAVGAYYIFMNSDVILTEDSFGKMIAFLKETPNAAMVGCQAINEKGEKFKAFDYALSLSTELFSDSLLHFLRPKKYLKRILTTKEPTKVGAVPGSLFTCVAKDFNAIGGFDDTLFLYYEEKDLAFRMKKNLNKDIYSLPFSEYIHLKGKSTKASQIIRNEMKISQFYVVQKNLGPLNYLLFYLFNFILFFLKSPFSKKNRAYFVLLLKGISVAKSIKLSQKII